MIIWYLLFCLFVCLFLFLLFVLLFIYIFQFGVCIKEKLNHIAKVDMFCSLKQIV